MADYTLIEMVAGAPQRLSGHLTSLIVVGANSCWPLMTLTVPRLLILVDCHGDVAVRMLQKLLFDLVGHPSIVSQIGQILSLFIILLSL